MTKSMERLEELTNNLPELSELETGIGGPAVLFDEPNGLPSFGLGVYRDHDIGVMRNYAVKGGHLSLHHHIGDHEWLGVIKGELLVRFFDNGEESIVVPNTVLHIMPGRPHSVTALAETWSWTVTVPPASGYPTVTSCPMAHKVPQIERSADAP